MEVSGQLNAQDIPLDGPQSNPGRGDEEEIPVLQ
jgi:hypothetical protein